MFHTSVSQCFLTRVWVTVSLKSFLSILTDLNDVVVWIVVIRPLSSISSSPCTNSLVTVSRVPITIVITVVFMFHSFILFFSITSQGRGTYLSFRFLSILWQCSQFCKLSLFIYLFIYLLRTFTWSDRLAEIRWFVCISKSQRTLCVLISRIDSRLCIYHLFVSSNFNFLHNFQSVTSPTPSFLVLHSFCANLLHSLIMW